MDTPNATRANSDLWAYYLEQQWAPVIALFGGRPAASVFGAAIANMYGVFFGELIGRVFAVNAGGVTRFVQETAAAEGTAPPPEPAPEPADVVPAWLRIVLDEIEEREQSEAAAARELQPVG